MVLNWRIERWSLRLHTVLKFEIHSHSGTANKCFACNRKSAHFYKVLFHGNIHSTSNLCKGKHRALGPEHLFAEARDSIKTGVLLWRIMVAL